jgi:hypothetical protein
MTKGNSGIAIYRQNTKLPVKIKSSSGVPNWDATIWPPKVRIILGGTSANLNKQILCCLLIGCDPGCELF